MFKKNRKQNHTLRWLKYCFVFSFGVVLLAAAIGYVITPALDRESQWQAQRLCKNYGHCANTGV